MSTPQFPVCARDDHLSQLISTSRPTEHRSHNLYRMFVHLIFTLSRFRLETCIYDSWTNARSKFAQSDNLKSEKLYIRKKNDVPGGQIRVENKKGEGIAELLGFTGNCSQF